MIADSKFVPAAFSRKTEVMRTESVQEERRGSSQHLEQGTKLVLESTSGSDDR